MNLLASLDCSGETHLVVGGNFNTAALRISLILASGANPVLLTTAPVLELPTTLQEHIGENRVKLVAQSFSPSLLTSLGRSEVDHVVDRVFVTLNMSQLELKRAISQACRRLRIPINVSDSAELSTFTLLSTYTSGDFQMGVTTTGKGCKLASRIKRELVGSLPPNIAEICLRVGELRRAIQQHDLEVGAQDEDAVHSLKFNALVEEFNTSEEQKATRRARWLSQIVEYYPLSKLADILVEDLEQKYTQNCEEHIAGSSKGAISLVGAGPGSVQMLTLGAIQEIHSADLVLADKLVPQQVLDLVPKKRTRLFIARKFPGNAEKAQEELLLLGLEALSRGEKVVRLKQGDPYIFGRGGEEYNFFSQHGFVPTVLPGITSALAAPVFANIPATHREVADQVLICTGTGRRGALPHLPEFVPSRTTVFLMALHRITELIPHLISEKNWDADLPVAIVERASCPDQRVTRTTLSKAAAAVEVLGSRPPGLFIAGHACKVLTGELKGDWEVEEGFAQGEVGGILEKLALEAAT